MRLADHNATHQSALYSVCRACSKPGGTRAETRFRLPPERTSPFKSAGASFQSTAGSRGVRISVSNAGYTTFVDNARVLATHSIRQFPLHFPSRASPCAVRFQLRYTSQRAPNRISSVASCTAITLRLSEVPGQNNSLCWHPLNTFHHLIGSTTSSTPRMRDESHSPYDSCPRMVVEQWMSWKKRCVAERTI
jgi:hypothetical protein